jgi:hypothetical protein
MKFLLILLFLVSGLSFAEINDQSFQNTDKYSMLKFPEVGESKEINLEIKFVPPKNQKVNHASFIKVWENDKKEWKLNSTFVVGDLPTFDYLRTFEKSVALHSKKSKIAIEIEFIHCGYSGGQCAMEKYLGKIERSERISNKLISAELKIK